MSAAEPSTGLGAVEVRHAPGVVLRLRYSDQGRQADLELDVRPVRASGSAAVRLVRSAVSAARANGVRHLRGGLSPSMPCMCWVLDALREADNADVEEFQLHRCGSSVMVDARLRVPRANALRP